MKGKKVQENYRVVFSIDDNFANYLGVTIQSLIDNSDKNKNYTVSILYDKLSEKSIENLLLLEESNVKIEFYNVCEYLEKLNIEGLDASMHWSVATYYRILIPFLFKDDKKVLYMDCDTVILDDVSKIFEVDLKRAEIAAVFDYDSVCYDKNRIKYIQDKLKLTDYKKYFNAGLILFDIERIEKQTYLNEFLSNLSKEFLFLDQDILNIIFKDKVKFLEAEWNYQYHILFPEFKKRYDLKLNKPKIIHYTTSNKPWNAPEYPMCGLWWKYARKTPFYEEIIYKNTLRVPIGAIKGLVKCLYSFYKTLSLFAFGKTKQKIKQKIKMLKPYK